MPSFSDLSSEILFAKTQLASLQEAFDLAIKKDVTLGEVKKIFHEMRLMQDKLNSLHQAALANSKTD